MTMVTNTRSSSHSGYAFATCSCGFDLGLETVGLVSLSVYSVSQKNPPLRFSEIFSQTVGNF